MSQKERVGKNIEKLICLKTHIVNNPNKKYTLIKEFMLTNGINKEKYLKLSNILKFENYLNQPININPQYTITQIIKNVVNNKIIRPKSYQESENDELIQSQNPLNYLSDRPIIKKKIKNKNNKNIILLKENLSFPKLNFSFNKEKDEEKNNFTLEKHNLKILIKNLEDELIQIKNEKNNKLEENNKLIFKNNYSFKNLKDKNKFVPNLCLSTKGFSEKYKHNINKYNNKIRNILSKNEKIKNINNRTYYNYIRNNNIKHLDLSDINKNLRLTEYIVMKRGKEKLFKQNFKDAFLN
jgi:hypothetical protein